MNKLSPKEFEQVKEIRSVKKKLKRGDMAIIARKVPCLHSAVSLFFRNQNLTCVHYKKIMSIAKKLIDGRK